MLPEALLEESVVELVGLEATDVAVRGERERRAHHHRVAHLLQLLRRHVALAFRGFKASKPSTQDWRDMTKSIGLSQNIALFQECGIFKKIPADAFLVKKRKHYLVD